MKFYLQLLNENGNEIIAGLPKNIFEAYRKCIR